MEAPDPLMPPQTSPWPTLLWLVILLVVVVASLVHAGDRRRWGWVAALAIVPPVAVPMYWIVNLSRSSAMNRRARPHASS